MAGTHTISGRQGCRGRGAIGVAGTTRGRMHDPKSLSRPAWWLGCLLVLVAVQYGWNAYDVLALSGFDAGAHAGYVLTIVREGRSPETAM